MRNEKLNRVLSSKAFYIVFSILASVALWMYIELIQNPDATTTVDNVQVQFINEDVLRDKNLIPTVRSPESVSLTFSCKRGIVPKLKSGTISVNIDLASITSNGFQSLPYEIEFPQDVNAKSVTLVSKSVDRITVRIEKMSEKPVPVVVRYDGGTSSEEYIAEAPEFTPNTIMISGQESVVSRISEAWVQVKRESLSATYTEELDFVLRDENGEELGEDRMETLNFSQDKVRVTIPVKMKKDVTLAVELIPGAGATAENTKLTFDPPKITLSGDPDVIKDYNTIMLGPIDLTKIDLSDSEMFPIGIPNNLVNLSGETEALVSIEVLGLELRHYQVTNIQVVNKPRGLEATIITMSLDVKLRGEAEDLDLITPSNIKVVADLSDYSEGSSSVPAKVILDGDTGDAGAVGEYKIRVTLERE